MRRYLETYGLPVTGNFVHKGRFGRGTTASLMTGGGRMYEWVNDAFDGKPQSITQSMVDYTAIDNADGVVVLDVMTEGLDVLRKLKEGADVRYYVLPLAQLPVAEPGVPPTPTDPTLVERFKAVVAAARDDPSLGDAYVRAELVRMGNLKEDADLYTALSDASDTILQKTPFEYEGKHKAWLPVFATLAVLAPRCPDAWADVEQPSVRRARHAAEVAARVAASAAAKEMGHGLALVPKTMPPPSLLVSGPVPPPIEDKMDLVSAEAHGTGKGKKRSADEAGLDKPDAVLQHLDAKVPKKEPRRE
jgi:hypothetical protein